MRPIVSVIVPVFNAGEHLNRCLGSLVTQTYPELDIIVVDDGSTDGSRDLIAEYAGREPRIRPVYQDNAGVSSARNAGLTAAKGDLVSFVDADDWLDADAYALVIEEANRVSADVVTFGYYVDSALGYHPKPVPDRYLTDGESDSGLGLLLETPNRFACTRVFSREVVEEIRFREDIHWGEDTIFVAEAMRRATRPAVVPSPLYHYVQSEGSATRSAFNPKRLTGIRMTEILEELVREGHPQLVPTVFRTRVNILGVLLQDVYSAKESLPPGTARSLKQYARRGLPRVVRDAAIPVPTKLKALVMAASPRAFVAAHRLGTVVRGG